MQKVNLPVITAAAGIAVNLGVSLLTVRYFGVYGLALGTVAAAVVMAILLWCFAAHTSKGILNRKLFFGIGKDIVGAMGLFITAREIRILIEGHLAGTLGTALGLLSGLIAGLAVYFILLKLLGSEELKTLAKMIKRPKNN